MANEPKQNLKQVKVDNWATYFLQKLQLLYAKGHCCDLTLKFLGGQELKVHRLVLNSCTKYFETCAGNQNVYELPETISYAALHPVINFMYSGKLEFKSEMQNAIIEAARILDMDILLKLLYAQIKDDVRPESSTPIKQYESKKSTEETSPKTATTPSVNSDFNSVLAGKKLPIWRKRNLLRHEDNYPLFEEDPKPSRFEWPVEDTSSILMTPSFSPISYDSMPVLQSPTVSSQPSLSIENKKAIKRRVVPPLSLIPEKIQRNSTDELNIEGTIENGEESEGVPQTLDSSPLKGASPSSDDDDDDDGHFETIHNYDDSDEENIPESSMNQLKPILKPPAETHNSTSLKKVRFSLGNDEVENKNPKSPEKTEAVSPTDKKNSAANHAKIIAEVFKKFPELVKNNKNIKLKITAPSGSSSKTTTLLIDSKIGSKSSFMLMKSSPNQKKTIQPLRVEKEVEKSDKTTSGPWLCNLCPTSEGPAKFDAYVTFSKHLQDYHTEKVSTRVCDYCGVKFSKRNLHLYHLYVRHNISPPKNVRFPKCKYCDHIAMTDSLLLKHQNSHQNEKEHTCLICNTSFKTASILQAHCVTCKPNNELRNYICKNCKKGFKTNVGLNAHMKICQAKGNEEKDDVKTENDKPLSMEMIEVPVLETVGIDKNQQHTLLQLPTGIILAESPNMTLLPSSEADGLNNVASGIATSIGLTVALPEDQAVILLDENSEFFLQGNNPVLVSNHGVEEFIVPEILHDSAGRIYSSTNPMSYTVGTTNIIAYPLMQVPNEKEIQSVQSIQKDTVKSSNFNNGLESKTTESRILNEKAIHLRSGQEVEELKEIIVIPSNHLLEDQISEKLLEKPLSPCKNLQENESPVLPLQQEDHSVTVVPISLEEQREEDLVAMDSSVESISQKSLSSETLHEETLINGRQRKPNNGKSIDGDWDFENDEESSEIRDDPELKPCRPTIDLQELP